MTEPPASTVTRLVFLEHQLNEDHTLRVGYVKGITLRMGVETVVLVQFGPDTPHSTATELENLLINGADSGLVVRP